MTVKKFKELEVGEHFNLPMQDKSYVLVAKFQAEDGTEYYLTSRAYGSTASGFFGTNGEKPVNAWNDGKEKR
ncbi:MAG: hypothetical protein LBB41_06675 [Prevotellaceae bacterium]|jgi:hypothetical protein|nr:hypothetical protein [Prevotellaceae bacterium]